MKVSYYFDTEAGEVFGGSCGLVTHALRQVFKRLNYAVEERFIPLSDKTSDIALPASDGGSDRDFRFFFEELFPRCLADAALEKQPNLVLFNLHFFSELEKLCKADVLIFNSKFMMECFSSQCADQGVRPPVLDSIPLAVPVLEFSEGYPSHGSQIDSQVLAELREESYLGHALRPHKSDPFAMLSIVHFLNQFAEKEGTRPFNVILPEIDLPRYEAQLEKMPLPEHTLDAFLPVEGLDNPSMITVMKSSCFSLCYDTVIEAFGFYPAESVYLGCPVYTNGSGNLRHLLPADHGISVDETLPMYFGEITDRIAAYEDPARRIFQSITSGQGKKECASGKDFISRSYSTDAMYDRLKDVIGRNVPRKKHPQIPVQASGKSFSGYATSPYLRLADWENGRFVTDLGLVEVDRGTSLQWKKLLDAGEAATASPGSMDVPVMVLRKFNS